MDKVPEIEIVNLNPGDILFIKFDTNIFDLEDVSNIVSHYKTLLNPKGIEVIGYPKSLMEFQVVRTL